MILLTWKPELLVGLFLPALVFLSVTLFLFVPVFFRIVVFFRTVVIPSGLQPARNLLLEGFRFSRVGACSWRFR